MAIMASAAPPRDPSELVPPGAHIAICTLVVDVGMQPGGKFDPRRQIYLGFELPELPPRKWKDKDGDEHERVQMIGSYYTLSLDKKAKLRGVLESWRGEQFSEEEVKAFDLAVVLGKRCMVNVLHNQGANGQTYANINVVMKAPPGKPIQAKGQLIEYSVDAPNPQLLEALPKFLRNSINNRILPKNAPPSAAADQQQKQEEFEDEVPF